MRRPTVLAVVCLAAAAVAAAVVAAGTGVSAAARVDAAAAPAGPAASPGAVLRSFVDAAGKGDAAKLWALLSKPTQKRLGPDYATFRKHAAVELTGGVGSFARSGGYRLVVAERLSAAWAVASIAGRRTVEGHVEDGAYGAALRGGPGGWRVELDGPVTLRILGPKPAEVVQAPEPQLAVEVNGPSAILGAVLYADAATVRSNAGGTSPKRVTIYGVATGATRKGVHVGTAIAATATDATATAWSFRLVPTKLPSKAPAK